MVSWLPHILVPGLFALAFFRPLPRKWVMWLALVAWVPDLDYISNYFSGSGHRVLTHNIWIPLLLLAASYGVWRLRHDGTPYTQAVTRPGWPLALLLSAYYWGSHVFLDIFAGGALLLWPLLETNFYLFYEIHMDLSTGKVEPVAEGGTEPGPPELSSDYTWLSFEHTAALAFLAATAVAAVAWRLWRRRGRTLGGPIQKG